MIGGGERAVARRAQTGRLVGAVVVIFFSVVRSAVVVGPDDGAGWCVGGGMAWRELYDSLEPVISMPSQRTTTTFWPARSSLATVEARRPRMWPEPSITISFSNICVRGGGRGVRRGRW